MPLFCTTQRRGCDDNNETQRRTALGFGVGDGLQREGSQLHRHEIEQTIAALTGYPKNETGLRYHSLQRLEYPDV